MTSSFASATGDLTLTNDYSTTGDFQSGRGSGGVALTINDGYGNANVTWNHRNGVPEQDGNAARIEVNTDATTGVYMSFEMDSGVTNGVAVGLPTMMTLNETGLTVNGTFSATGYSPINWDTAYTHSQVTTGNPHSISTGDIGAVPTGRTISTAGGLTGGGDLSANRTITLSSVDAAVLANSVIADLTDIGAAIASTDEFMISDGGLIRKSTINRLESHMEGALGFASTSGDTFTGDVTFSADLRAGQNSSYRTFLSGGILLKDYTDPSVNEGGAMYYQNDRWNFRGAGTAENTGTSNTEMEIYSGGGFKRVIHAGNYTSYVVPTSRSISTSGGLTGGGDLTQDRTITLTSVDGSVLANDVISFQDDIASSIVSTDEFLISDAGVLKKTSMNRIQTYVETNLTLTASDVGAVPWSEGASINVNAGNETGLYAGSTASFTNRGPSGNNAGALFNINTHPGDYYSQLWFNTAGDEFYFRSANNTLPTASWQTVIHSGNVSSYAVPTSRQIIAGTGLSGGGSLTQNRTINMDYLMNQHVRTSDSVTFVDVTTTSDSRVKEIESTLDGALEMVRKVKGYKGTKEGHPGLFYIAQEIEQIVPNVIEKKELNGYDDFRVINNMGMQVVNTMAIKDLDSEVDQLKKKITKLENEIEELREAGSGNS